MIIRLRTAGLVHNKNKQTKKKAFKVFFGLKSIKIRPDLNFDQEDY